MLNFEFSLPTRIIFGKDTHKNVGQIIADMNYKKVLLVYDGGTFLQETGLLKEVLDSLSDAGLEVSELTGVQPNPRLSLCYTGIELCKENDVEFILALGGGSTIDTAKTIAAGAKYDGDVWDYFSNVIGQHPIFDALPIGVIVTIAATGSETNGGAMITNENGNLKYGAGGPALIPTFAVCNPELTCSLPVFKTACGIADMYSHVVERYFTPTEDTYVIDAMCEGIFRSLQEVGPKLLADPKNYILRSEIMYTGTIAHNDTVGVGRVQDWATHGLAHELQGLYDTPHGVAISIMMYAWMRYVYKENIERFVRYAKYAMGINVNEMTPEEAAAAGIEKTAQFLKALGMPLSLSEIEIDDSKFEEMADKALANGMGTLGFFKPLTKEDIVAIYKLAK